MKKSEIHLIRHGKTEGNEKSWYYGSLDIPILKKGIDELLELKNKKIYPDINGTFFISGMLRTKQTLDTIYQDVQDIIVIKELQEINFGIFEGKTYEELKNVAEYQNWLNDEEGNYVIPNGESKIQFRDRVMAGLQKIKDIHSLKELEFRHKTQIVNSLCVCHGGVIGCIMSHIFGDGRDFFNWIVGQGRGYTLIIQDGKIVDYRKI